MAANVASAGTGDAKRGSIGVAADAGTPAPPSIINAMSLPQTSLLPSGVHTCATRNGSS